MFRIKLSSKLMSLTLFVAMMGVAGPFNASQAMDEAKANGAGEVYAARAQKVPEQAYASAEVTTAAVDMTADAVSSTDAATRASVEAFARAGYRELAAEEATRAIADTAKAPANREAGAYGVARQQESAADADWTVAAGDDWTAAVEEAWNATADETWIAAAADDSDTWGVAPEDVASMWVAAIGAFAPCDGGAGLAQTA